MKVYHFLNEEFGLKDLREKRLKVSRLMDLNDPFEFLGADLSDKSFRKAMNDTKKQLSIKNGMICFSKSWKNPVQWSHYADRHRGICLGFDIPDDHLIEVEYLDARISHDGNITPEIMRRFLTTKFSHWSYEQEVRAFVSLENEEEGFYYKDFSGDLKLREVIVGAQSSVKRKVIEELVSDESSVEIYKVRPAFRSFDIVRNQNQALWA